MIQYKNFIEKDYKMLQELFLNILNVFNEVQIKRYKGFVPFNLKIYNTEVEKINNIEFNNIHLKKLETKNSIYRYYLPDDQFFSGVQRVFNRKIERELEIINSSNNFFDFSIFPFDELLYSDEDYINGDITYRTLMENKDYLDIYYKYIKDRLYFNEKLTFRHSGQGRVLDLKLSNPTFFDNFEFDFTYLDGIKEEEYDEPFVLFFLSLFEKKIHLYKIPLTELFEKIEHFDISIDKIIHKDINVFDKEQFELGELINLQLNGKNTSNLFGVDKFEKLETIPLNSFVNNYNYSYNNKFKMRILKPNEYDFEEDDNFLIILPFIQSFRNLKMFNPNVFKITNNSKLVYVVNGGSF